MNNLYLLKKLTFNNFKLFGEEFTVNFNKNDLVVFDGPNGHGKTTVYDAIELALTGTIRRLNSTEDLQTPNDVVVAYKNNADCFVRLELRNDIGKIIVERRLKTYIPNNAKKIRNFKNLWDLILISNNEQKIITQFQFNKLIGSPNLERDFTLFHYVEQEDSAHFLKQKKEKLRAETLSVLFGDTVEMQNKVSKIHQVEKRIEARLKEKKQEKLILENRGNIRNTEAEQEVILSFRPLLEWKEFHFEWDREKVENFTNEKKDSFLAELSNIDKLLKHRELYLNRRKYTLAADQHGVVGYSQYMDRLNQFKAQFKRAGLVKSLAPLLSIDRFSSLLDFPYLGDVFKLVGFESGNEFLKTLKRIVDGKAKNHESSKFLLELLEYRHHLKIHLVAKKYEKNCILCDSYFDDNTLLIGSIEKKELSLKSILSSDDQRLEELQSDFLKNVLPVLSKKITKYLSETVAPSAELIRELEQAIIVAERLDKLKYWLDQEAIIYSDLLLTYRPENNSEMEIDRCMSTLRDRILKKIKQGSEDYNEANEEGIFENVFKIYFDTNSNFLKVISSTDVNIKRQYIQKLFFDSISSDIKNYQLVTQEIATLGRKKDIVSNLRKNLNSAVSRYQKLLIKDIEIPFYIYSGKVLQSHQSGFGSGILIKDKTGGDQLKNIRFVSNWKSDHDVINTMSSGQIAAVIITFYLALNKVYSKGFGALLIDDPVQTMDEINMISLVELLRNEFSDRQIILSTHEDHVSRYFIYKFLKYKRKVRQIKLFDRKEYQLSNL